MEDNHFTILWFFCHISTRIGHRYTCVPPSWSPLPPLSPPYPSGLSQSTSFGCIELVLVTKIVLNIKYKLSPRSAFPKLPSLQHESHQIPGCGAGFLTSRNRPVSLLPSPLSPAASLRHPQASELHRNSGMFPANPLHTKEEARKPGDWAGETGSGSRAEFTMAGSWPPARW